MSVMAPPVVTAPPASGPAQVPVAPGDVDRTCPGCGGGPEGDPRHVVVGGRTELQMATLSETGQQVPVQVPRDVAYHIDCHAALGCSHCEELLAAHDGSVKGKAHEMHGLPSVPEHLVKLEPHEFQQGGEGIQVRVRSKTDAARVRVEQHEWVNDVDTDKKA